MYNVMLIEDEPPILEMFKNMIDAAPYPFVVKQTAFNGLKALDLLEKSVDKPDLIITDIRMPIMDGLQFMKEITDRGYNIPCIILSGYSDFEYAREALRYNVLNYLLKPLKESHLDEALEKLFVLLERRKEIAERSYIKRILHLPDDLTEVPLNPGYPAYQILLLRIGGYRTDGWEEGFFNDMKREWDEQAFGEYLREELSTETFWVINGSTSNEKIIVCAIDDKGNQICSRAKAKSVRLTCSESNKFNMDRRPVSIAVSESVAPENLLATLRTLRKALMSKMEIGKSCLWIHGDPLTHVVLTYELEQACRSVALSPNFDLFSKAIQELIKEWQEEMYRQQMIEKIFTTITHYFNSQWSDHESLPIVLFDANEIVSECQTLEEAFESFCEYFKDVYENIKRKRSQFSAKDLIQGVQAYLDNHFMEPVSSDTLQKIFGYNKTYISNVFSDVVGVPPSKYLAKLRVDKAIDLLNGSTDLSIRQIAELVGYEDSLYFSKVFKSAVGVSPTEYKDMRDRQSKGGISNDSCSKV